MNHLAEFGGRYGGFVWSAYGFAAVALATMVFDTLRLARRWRRAARSAERLTDEATETRPPD